MKRNVIFLIIILLISSTGCTSSGMEKYSYEFTGTFDTVIQIMGYANTQKQFEEMSKKCHEMFIELDKIFDIYDSFEGINNLKTVNDMAGIGPVNVDPRIIDLLEFSLTWSEKTGDIVNIALGPVLRIWHEYRTEGISDPKNARLPDMDLLKEAKFKTDINKIQIDKENNTVFLEEKGMVIDVGAVAKGYATEIVCDYLIKEGYTSFIISAGGNVKTVGKPADGVRVKWGIGLQNPDANPYIPVTDVIDTVYINDLSVVSSGDYQRYYFVDEKRYHHIINPKTLMPADYYRAVNIITEDSGVADFISTTAYCLPYEESRKLIEGLDGVEAMWIFPDGNIETTENMKIMLKVIGGATNNKK